MYGEDWLLNDSKGIRSQDFFPAVPHGAGILILLQNFRGKNTPKRNIIAVSKVQHVSLSKAKKHTMATANETVLVPCKKYVNSQTEAGFDFWWKTSSDCFSLIRKHVVLSCIYGAKQKWHYQWRNYKSKQYFFLEPYHSVLPKIFSGAWLVESWSVFLVYMYAKVETSWKKMEFRVVLELKLSRLEVWCLNRKFKAARLERAVSGW